jgi:hypothetical protein
MNSRLDWGCPKGLFDRAQGKAGQGRYFASREKVMTSVSEARRRPVNPDLSFPEKLPDNSLLSGRAPIEG